MKKAIPVVLLLAIIATAVIFHLRRPRESYDLAPGRAAELAPADTMIFFELPNIARSLERWKKNGLYLISQEPEWKEFAAKWDAFAAENENAREFFGVYDQIAKADPAGLFLAFTKEIEPFPKMVGGFPYRGKKSDVENVVRQLKDQLLKTWPGAKSELSKYEEIEIETITSVTAPSSAPTTVPGTPPAAPVFPKVHLAYRDNWFFFATDKDLLAGTLTRYLRKTDAAPGLAKDAIFDETLKHGNADPDLTMWARGTVVEQATSALASLGISMTPLDPAGVKDSNPVQAFLYSWKLDGPIMRDRFYVQMTRPPTLPPLEHRSVALTTPATYAYADFNYEDVMKRTKDLWELSAKTNLEKELVEMGLTPLDFVTAFGPEMMLSSAWPDGVLSLWPDFFAALEVRDASKARKLAEYLAKELKFGDKPALMTTEGGLTRWVSPEGLLGFARPAIGLTDRHLMFGLTPTALDNAVKQLATKGLNVATKPGSPYPAAVQTVNAPQGALFYLDTKTLFERVYSRVKPMIAFQLVGAPDIAKYFDAGKLPQDTTISKHLQPIVISIGTDSRGWLVEGTGTFSFLGMYTVTLPAAFWARSASPVGIPLSPATAPSRSTLDIGILTTQLNNYQAINGKFPTTQQGLVALVIQPISEPVPSNWKKLMSDVPTDFWGKPYEYRSPGKHNKDSFDLFSNGPDGVPETADDLGNW